MTEEKEFVLKITSDKPCPFLKRGKIISEGPHAVLAEHSRCILRDEVPCYGVLVARPVGCLLEDTTAGFKKENR